MKHILYFKYTDLNKSLTSVRVSEKIPAVYFQCKGVFNNNTSHKASKCDPQTISSIKYAYHGLHPEISIYKGAAEEAADTPSKC